MGTEFNAVYFKLCCVQCELKFYDAPQAGLRKGDSCRNWAVPTCFHSNDILLSLPALVCNIVNPLQGSWMKALHPHLSVAPACHTGVLHC